MEIDYCCFDVLGVKHLGREDLGIGGSGGETIQIKSVDVLLGPICP